MKFEVRPGGNLQGRIRVPGDKSISHRAVMLGSIADGRTTVRGFLDSEDALATLAAFRAMGVAIEGPEHGRLVIDGVGLHGLRRPTGALDLGNSGTSMRLLAGLLSGQRFDSVLTGDASLTQRPMERVAVPLRAMGATIDTADGTPPLSISGGRALRGVRYETPVASAQVKSALLLAGLYASGRTEVIEPASSRDHTERMLRGFGYRVDIDGHRIGLEGGGRLGATAVDVPGDISSAAFFLVGASIAPGSDLVIEHVGVNPTRAGVIEILRAMGADITLLNRRESGGEPVADLRVRAATLHGIEIPAELVAPAIDEFPAVFVAAACARGTTTLRNAGELRVKESDRIAAMVDGLSRLGIDAQPLDDGVVITGGEPDGGAVDSFSDHRVAMALAIAALGARQTVTVNDCANVATSFPGFARLAGEAGLQIRQIDGVAP